MKMLYKFRGFILGIFAVALLLCEPSPFSKFYFFDWIALLFFLAGIFIRIEARRSIGEHTRRKIHEAEELITSGTYAYLRHPLYFSNTLIAWSFIFFYFEWSFLSLIFAFLILLFELLLAHAEDEFLKNKFTETWVIWAKKTPAFFPKFSNRSKSTTKKRSFITSFLADISTWFWLSLFLTILILRKTFVF